MKKILILSTILINNIKTSPEPPKMLIGLTESKIAEIEREIQSSKKKIEELKDKISEEENKLSKNQTKLKQLYADLNKYKNFDMNS